MKVMIRSAIELTILLHKTEKKLRVKGQSEELALFIVRQELKVAVVSFTICPVAESKKKLKVRSAFTAEDCWG